MSAYHLVILKRPYLNWILCGAKTVESRFMKSRRPELGRLKSGDVLVLKASSGPVCGLAKVSRVKTYENLTPERMGEIQRRYNDLILGPDEYWAEKAHARYGLLAWLEDVREIEPVKIDKKDWRAWVVLAEGRDFGLIKALLGYFEACV